MSADGTDEHHRPYGLVMAAEDHLPVSRRKRPQLVVSAQQALQGVTGHNVRYLPGNDRHRVRDYLAHPFRLNFLSHLIAAFAKLLARFADVT